MSLGSLRKNFPGENDLMEELYVTSKIKDEKLAREKFKNCPGRNRMSPVRKPGLNFGNNSELRHKTRKRFSVGAKILS